MPSRFPFFTSRTSAGSDKDATASQGRRQRSESTSSTSGRIYGARDYKLINSTVDTKQRNASIISEYAASEMPSDRKNSIPYSPRHWALAETAMASQQRRASSASIVSEYAASVAPSRKYSIPYGPRHYALADLENE